MNSKIDEEGDKAMAEAERFINSILAHPKRPVHEIMVEYIATNLKGRESVYALSVQSIVIYKLFAMLEHAIKAGVMVSAPLVNMTRPELSKKESIEIARQLISGDFERATGPIPSNTERRPHDTH